MKIHIWQYNFVLGLAKHSQRQQKRLVQSVQLSKGQADQERKGVTSNWVGEQLSICGIPKVPSAGPLAHVPLASQSGLVDPYGALPGLN